MKRVIIVGAGIGGMSAALNLQKNNYDVTLIEASSELGGLARSETFGNVEFDAGPYILLDKPGLEWSFEQLGYNLQKSVPLKNLEHVYNVNGEISFYSDAEKTAALLSENTEGLGAKYLDFVKKSNSLHQMLSPHTYQSKPSPWNIIKKGQFSLIPFMLSNLQAVLRKYGFTKDLENAIGIWTHVAAQKMSKAPAPMSFVPSLIHNVGAYYPTNGMGSIASFLGEELRASGIKIISATRVNKVNSISKKIQSIECVDGQIFDCDALLCNMSAIGAYSLMPNLLPQSYQRYLNDLPLQSPGICAYLKVKSNLSKDAPYLQFNTKHKILPTIAFVNPGILSNGSHSQARIVAPLDYSLADSMSEDEQLSLLDELIEAQWWKSGIEEFEVLHKRTSRDWGTSFHLYKNSMNPVMTASFMRKGRIAHKSPFAQNLFFCGSSTHPGQWVSFAAISGILSSNLIVDQFGRG